MNAHMFHNYVISSTNSQIKTHVYNNTLVVLFNLKEQ